MILIDANVFMDLLEERDGLEASAQAIELVREKKVRGCVSALTIPILWFLNEKRFSEEIAKKMSRTVTKGFLVVPLDSNIISKAFESKMADFEDAIQLNSAIKSKCEFIITRNKRDFIPEGSIKILTPEEFLAKRK